MAKRSTTRVSSATRAAQMTVPISAGRDQTVWTVTRLTCHPSPTDLRFYLCAGSAAAHQAPRPVKKASSERCSGR
eukprot:6140508-Prymnesium_polylepis.1